MEKINFEYYSLLQKNQLNEVLTQKSPLLNKKVRGYNGYKFRKNKFVEIYTRK